MFQIYESRMFRAAPGGYIFQAPPLTKFHRPATYVVDEARKTQILAVLRAPTWLSVGRVMFLALLLGAAVGIVTALYHSPLWVSAMLAFEAWIIATIFGIGFAMHLKLRKLEPILASLPRSDEQLF